MTTTPARPALDAMAEELERLDKLATPWPWQVRFMHRVFDSARKDPINLFDTEAKQDWTDCELIVYLRNNAPALVAALRALAEMRGALIGVVPPGRRPEAHCWCHPGRDIELHGHETCCVNARQALARSAP